MRWLPALAAVTACYHPTAAPDVPCSPSGACPGGQVCDTTAAVPVCVGLLDAGAPDAAHDGATDGATDGALIDAPLTCAAWTSKHISTCALPPPPPALALDPALSPYVYDTSAGTLTDTNGHRVTITRLGLGQQSGPGVEVWVVGGLAVPSGVDVDVTGARALVIAAWDTISVDGTLDVGSYVGGRTGPGANPAITCNTHGPDAGSDGSNGTGGGGGGDAQGSGGTGGAGTSTAVMGGVGGTPLVTPRGVVGGCSGGDGGSGPNDVAGGGDGGGALLLTARLAITVTGQLLAGGGGGQGDASTTEALGGGGGGAGGYLGLEAPAIDVSRSTLAANGGGGGGGAGPTATGANGGDGPASTQGGAPGASGMGGAPGGPGGALALRDGQSGGGGASSGGGGGGGAGFVLYWGGTPVTSGATISPALAAGP